MSDIPTLRQLVQDNQLDAAYRGYTALAETGNQDAMAELGHVILCGVFAQVPMTEGVQWLLRAEAHSPQAAYALAVHALAEIDASIDWAVFNQRVRDSAQQGFPLSLRALALFWAQFGTASEQALSTLCLEHAAARGDAVSLALLCKRLQNGTSADTNPARAAAMAAWLNQQGFPLALPMQSVRPELIAHPSLPALPELPLADFALRESAHAKIEEHSVSPRVAIAQKVINAEECFFLQSLAAPHLSASMTADDAGHIARVQVRTSYDLNMSFEYEDVSARLIQRAMMRTLDKPLKHAENMVVLRYRPGQEYKPHRDYLPPSHYVALKDGGAGQRQHTVIVFLQSAKAGGETVFPELNLKFPTQPGDCLLFDNLLPDGEPDTRTLHAGNPVLFGEKWIATLWVRQASHRRA